jgi:hypothetical protein
MAPKIDFHDGRFEGTINHALSVQSLDLLEKLAKLGIYGESSAEVGARLVDKSLQEFVHRPQFAQRESEDLPPITPGDLIQGDFQK